MRKHKIMRLVVVWLLVMLLGTQTFTVAAFSEGNGTNGYGLPENVATDTNIEEEQDEYYLKDEYYEDEYYEEYEETAPVAITGFSGLVSEIEILNVEVLFGGQYQARWRIGSNHPNYDFNFTRHTVYGYADRHLFDGSDHQPGRWYTTARNANMQDPRLFTVKFIVPGSFTGVGTNPGEFNVNNLDWSYGGRELSAWTTTFGLAGITAVDPGARVRIEGTPIAVCNGDGSVTVTAGLRFGSFVSPLPLTAVARPWCTQWPHSWLMNRPWGTHLTYWAMTSGSGIYLANRVGYHAFVAYYNGVAVANRNIRFSVNDVFKAWAELDGFLASHPANVANAPLGLDNHGPYNRFLKIESFGQGTQYVGGVQGVRRELWAAILSDSRASVDHYLNVTQPLMNSNPAQLQAELSTGPGPNQHRGVLFFSAPHGNEFPGPGLMYELMYRLIEEDELVFTRAANYNRLIPNQYAYATAQSAHRYRVGLAYEELRLKVDDLLERYIIVLLFSANPDGFANAIRGTYYNFDVNRDGLAGVTPEGRALQRAVSRWDPVAFLDIHGYFRNFLMDGTTMPWAPFFEADLIDAHSLSMIDSMGMSIIGRSAMDLYNVPTRDAATGWDGGTAIFNPSMSKLFGSIGFTIELPDNTQDAFDAMMQGFYGFFNYVIDDNVWSSVMYNKAEFKRRNILNLDLRDVVDSHMMRVHPAFYVLRDHPSLPFVMPEQRVVGRPRTPNPAGGYFNFFPEYHVIPVCKNMQMSPGAAFETLYLLANVGVQVERTTQPVTYNGVTYPIGTFVVSMHQAHRAFAHAVLVDGHDVSGYISAGGEAVLSFPRKRGFETDYVRTPGVFTNRTVSVSLSEVALTVPRVNITGGGDVVIIRNDSPDAIRLVNRILRAGNDVNIITGHVGGASLGDFVAQRSHVMAAAQATYNRVFGQMALTVNGFGLGTATGMPELSEPIQAPHVGYWYWSVPWSDTIRYFLDLYEFQHHTRLTNTYTPVPGATVYLVAGTVGTVANNFATAIRGDLADKIRTQGIPVIVGDQQAQFPHLLTNPADRFTRRLTPGEGLLRANVTENIILSNLGNLEAVYIGHVDSCLFQTTPSWITPIISVQDSDDFSILNRMAPGRAGSMAEYRGTTIVGTGIYTTNLGVDIPITAIAPNIFERHSMHLYYRIVATALFAKTSGIDITEEPLPSLDFTELMEAITAANALTQAHWTVPSWNAMQAALAAAQAARIATTQGAIDNAAAALNAAIAALLNITELQAAIAAANALTETHWTVASWSAMQTALTAAQAALTATTQEAIVNATDALTAAIAALVRRPTAEPGTGTGPGVVTPPVTQDPDDEDDIDDPEVPLAPGDDYRFRDVNSGHWFYGAVSYVYENDIMRGVSADMFAPNASFNRAMAATVLFRMAGAEASFVQVFDDVAAGQWYSEAITWAAQNGIVLGIGNNLFDPYANVTREQLAAMFFRYATFMEFDMSTSELTGFVDVADVSYWALEAMSWAVHHEIIQGMTGNRLNPRGTATRAECATIIMRMMETFN